MTTAERLQLPLPFQHEPSYDASDFLPAASNADAIAWLETERGVDWPDRRLALWGPAGCGKSHLLHIWAQRTGARLLSGKALRDLDCIPGEGDLALDDADTVVGEQLLLHLLNTGRDRALRILLTGRTPPSRWPFRLPDLASRLRALTAVEIHQPTDALLAAMLVRLLADRQLTIAPAVQEWLLLRLPRSPAALRETVARLDRASLAFGTRITRILAARVLAATDFAIADADEAPASGFDPSSQHPRFL